MRLLPAPKRSHLLAAAILALCVSLTACDGGGSRPGSTPVQGEPSAAAPGTLQTKASILSKDAAATKHAEVTWGWLFEQSGAFAPLGKASGDGVLLAVQEINAAGGFQVGDTIYTITLEQYDSKSDPMAAAAAATELVRDKHVRVLWGPTSPGDIQVANVTQPNHVLHLCPCPERELTLLTGEGPAAGEAHWAFQVAGRQSTFLELLAKDIKREYPNYGAVGGVCSATELGKGYCQFLRDAFVAEGFEFVGERLVPADTTDFSPVLTDLQRQDPDIVMTFLDAGPATFTFVRDATELGVGEMYLVPAAPYELIEGLAGERIRDRIILAGSNPRTEIIPTSEEVNRFLQGVLKPFAGGTLPLGAGTALNTYDAVYMLVAAMEQAGSVDDTDAIVEALERVHFDGLSEDDLFFDSSHIMHSGDDICTVTSGGYQECHHVSLPGE
jgi:branched-chain amino acid transport system substrate-binding protein